MAFSNDGLKRGEKLFGAPRKNASGCPTCGHPKAEHSDIPVDSHDETRRCSEKGCPCVTVQYLLTNDDGKPEWIEGGSAFWDGNSTHAQRDEMLKKIGHDSVLAGKKYADLPANTRKALHEGGVFRNTSAAKPADLPCDFVGCPKPAVMGHADIPACLDHVDQVYGSGTAANLKAAGMRENADGCQDCGHPSYRHPDQGACTQGNCRCDGLSDVKKNADVAAKGGEEAGKPGGTVTVKNASPTEIRQKLEAIRGREQTLTAKLHQIEEQSGHYAALRDKPEAQSPEYRSITKELGDLEAQSNQLRGELNNDGAISKELQHDPELVKNDKKGPLDDKAKAENMARLAEIKTETEALGEERGSKVDSPSPEAQRRVVDIDKQVDKLLKEQRKIKGELQMSNAGDAGDIAEIERHVEGIEHELGEMKEDALGLAFLSNSLNNADLDFDMLRREFGSHATISMDSAEKLMDILDRADDAAILRLCKENIKFVTPLAQNRARSRGLKENSMKNDVSASDLNDFRGYLRQCSDRQVQGVYDKEKSAGRDEYADLAQAEADRRGITLENSVKNAGAHVGWIVTLNGEEIDKVFYVDGMTADQVKRGLIDHDGYDSRIEVKQESRKNATDKPVCPNCDQWQSPTEADGGIFDCHNQCAKRGFAPKNPSKGWNAEKKNATESKVYCPKCRQPIHDLAFGPKLNKCWGCGTAFDVGVDKDGNYLDELENAASIERDGRLGKYEVPTGASCPECGTSVSERHRDPQHNTPAMTCPKCKNKWIIPFKNSVMRNGVEEGKKRYGSRENAIKVPKDFQVQPLKPGENPKGKTTCGTCNLSWDDDKITGITPAPSGRCPFEAFHKY